MRAEARRRRAGDRDEGSRRAPGVGQPGRRLRRRHLVDARPRRRASCSGAATARWCATSPTRRRRPASTRVAWGRAELFTIPSSDGKFQLPAYWVLPPDFSPKRQYPVIFTIYGGPDAGTVQNGWPSLSAHYWAQRGVITISVDHRGSGHFGKAGTALMHRQLGKWEMTDLTHRRGVAAHQAVRPGRPHRHHRRRATAATRRRWR